MTTTFLGPKRPIEGAWTFLGEIPIPGEVSGLWRLSPLQVISSFGDMEYSGIVMPHWHVSVAIFGGNRRATNEEVDIVRKAFDLEDAEEDNHSSGVARHLFRPVSLPKGTVGVCDCKGDEEIVTEPDGFQWSRTKEKE